MYKKGFFDSLCKKNDGSDPKTRVWWVCQVWNRELRIIYRFRVKIFLHFLHLPRYSHWGGGGTGGAVTRVRMHHCAWLVHWFFISAISAERCPTLKLTAIVHPNFTLAACFMHCKRFHSPLKRKEYHWLQQCCWNFQRKSYKNIHHLNSSIAW